jgi:hypothetical protein
LATNLKKFFKYFQASPLSIEEEAKKASLFDERSRNDIICESLILDPVTETKDHHPVEAKKESRTRSDPVKLFTAVIYGFL